MVRILGLFLIGFAIWKFRFYYSLYPRDLFRKGMLVFPILIDLAVGIVLLDSTARWAEFLAALPVIIILGWLVYALLIIERGGLRGGDHSG